MSQRLKAILQALFVVFLWATSWVLIKSGLGEIPPLTFAGLRYTLAFACLLPVAVFSPARRELRALPLPVWLRFILLGLLFYAVTQGASFVALAYLPAITVNLLWSFSSVFVALLGALLLAERPTWLQACGIGLALLGAMLFFYPVEFPGRQVAGLLAAALGILANAVSAVLGRAINRSGQFNPLLVTAISMGAGSLVLLGAGLAVEGWPQLSWGSWAIIAWLALVNTAFAFSLWNHVLRTLTAVESSVINGTMLIWIPLFAVLLLGETLTARGLLGLAAVGAGTLLVQLRRQ